MYDGTNVILKNDEYDDYGSPSKEFKAISEFDLNYWNKPYNSEHSLTVNKKWVADNAESEFYWHSDFPPIFLDPTDFDIVKNPDYWLLLDKLDKNKYHVLLTPYEVPEGNELYVVGADIEDLEDIENFIPPANKTLGYIISMSDE